MTIVNFSTECNTALLCVCFFDVNILVYLLVDMETTFNTVCPVEGIRKAKVSLLVLIVAVVDSYYVVANDWLLGSLSLRSDPRREVGQGVQQQIGRIHEQEPMALGR